MTSNAAEDQRILGTLGSSGGAGLVRIEDRFETGVDELWSAITEPSRLAGWLALVEGDLRPGGQFTMNVVSDGVVSAGRIDQCEAPHRLVVTTRESDESYQEGQGVPPFDEVIEATLTAEGDQTVLVVEVRGMPLDVVAFYGVGWQIHVESLGRHLTGQERGDTEPRWAELIPAYQDLAARLG